MSVEENKNLTDLILKQNKLLEQQSKLIKQLMAERTHSVKGLLLPGEKIFVENLFRDEIRDGFLVTAHRKRLWNIELNLIAEFDRICKKHNLRWFAICGTLLGAVRHKGFIPWDDDIDLGMLRPDYEKLKAIIKSEVPEYCFVDAWHDYKLEEEDPNILQDKSCLQVVKREQRQGGSIWWPFWPIMKIKDSRTAFIQYLDRPHVHQGMWIDIFPIDPVPPFSNIQNKIAFEVERELLFAIALPKVVRDALKENPPAVVLSVDEMEQFLKLSHTEKVLAFEKFALKNFFHSEFIGEVRDFSLIDRRNRVFKFETFEQTVYLPFEKTELPCPAGYNDYLIALYGEWRKPDVYKPHAKIYSADFSYKDFFNSVKFV